MKNSLVKKTDTANAPDNQDAEVNFVPSEGLTTADAERLLSQWGRNELVEEKTPKWRIILGLFTGPMPIILWIAAIIEATIENWPDMGILLGIQFINAGISFYESNKAGNAVAALKASLKPKATIKRDGTWQTIDAGGVVPGDLVLLSAGAAVPADCFVNKGEIEVDQSAMTGESLPVKCTRGGSCKMGSTVTRGETEATVECTGQNTFFGKTAAMLSTVDDSGGSLRILMLRTMTVLVGFSLILCIIAFVYIVIQGMDDKNRQDQVYTPSSQIVKEALSFAVVILVATIPVAMQIVVTTTLALGSSRLSKHGAIVTRLTAIEELAGVEVLCSDKTGTLTLNKMVVQEDCPVLAEGEDRRSLMFQAALAAKWKEPPKDALDTMILRTGLALPEPGLPDSDVPIDAARAAEGRRVREELDRYEQVDYSPFDPATKRTEAKLRAPDGTLFRVAKGAPQVMLDMCTDKARLAPLVEAAVHDLARRGIRALAVARGEGEDGPWRLLGMLSFLDPPRPDTKATVAEAGRYGIEVKMITGDQRAIAAETARTLGMGDRIEGPEGLPRLADGGRVPDHLLSRYASHIVPTAGFAQVLPEHKFLIVECLRQAGFRCGMTGDGVNDAPALRRADVGIAVAGATDAARAAADIVLTGEGLSTCIVAIKTAREIFQRLKSFVTYRISASLQLLVFFFIAVFALPPRTYYVRNGIRGVDNVTTNPRYGGRPPAPGALDSLVVFDLPRRSWICPGGLVGGANDPRLGPYREVAVQRTRETVDVVYMPGGRDVVGNTTTLNRSVEFFNVDAMHPAAPGIQGFDPGCSIILPICQTRDQCLYGPPPSPNSQPSESNGTCPPYQICFPWPLYFQLPVLMLMLITLLNDGAIISIGYDHVQPSPVPERWNISLLFVIAIMLGVVACGSSLLLLWAALDSNNPHGVFARMGLPPMEYGKIVTMTYLKVSLTNFLTLFSARVQDKFFFMGMRPGTVLLTCALASLVTSTFLASFWPVGTVDGMPVKGLALGEYTLMPLWVWIYTLIWWFIQDICKVVTMRICKRIPIFQPHRVDRSRYDPCHTDAGSSSEAGGDPRPHKPSKEPEANRSDGQEHPARAAEAAAPPSVDNDADAAGQADVPRDTVAPGSSGRAQDKQVRVNRQPPGVVVTVEAQHPPPSLWQSPRGGRGGGEGQAVEERSLGASEETG